MRTSHKNAFVTVVTVSLCLSLCGGCSGLKYHDIFCAGVVGGGIGGIIGYQSDECEAGVLVGAAVFATGELLHQIDRLAEKEAEKAAEEVARGDYLLGPRYLEP